MAGGLAQGAGMLGDLGSILQSGVGTAVRTGAAAGYAGAQNQPRQDLANEVNQFGVTNAEAGQQMTQGLDAAGMGFDTFLNNNPFGNPNQTANFGSIYGPRMQNAGGATGIAAEGLQHITQRADADIQRIMDQGQTAFGEFGRIADQGIAEFKNYVADGVASYTMDSAEAMANLQNDLQSAVSQGMMTPQAAFMYQRQAGMKMNEQAKNATRSLTLQAGGQAANLYMQKAAGLGQLRSQFAATEAGVRGQARGDIQNGINSLAAGFLSDQNAAREWATSVQQIKRDQATERYAAVTQVQMNRLNAVTSLYNAFTEDNRFVANLFSGVASDIQASAPAWSQAGNNIGTRQAAANPPQQGGGGF